MDKYEEIADLTLRHLGSPANVIEVENCITRMRVQVRDISAVDLPNLKQVPSVLGVVVDGSEVQVVFGPGVVDKATTAVEAVLATSGAAGGAKGAVDAEALAKAGAAIKAEQKKRNETPMKQLLRRIANIFVPLIPALIGCGIIAGLNGLLLNFANTNDWTFVTTWITPYLAVIGGGFMAAMPIFVGYNAAKEFGGSPILGGAIGAIVIVPSIAKVPSLIATIAQQTAADGGTQLLLVSQGGVLGAMFAAILGAYIERWVRTWAPDSISMLVVPTVTMLLAGGATVLFIMSIAGWITTGIGDGANWLLAHAGAFAGLVLGGLFLPVVMLGLHQALIPIHTTLIESSGYTILLPILAMAGAGQVGASIAIYLRLKRNVSMRRVIKSALPAGFLGVGEPLIYGVSLPLGRPFITACIGGAIGGGFIGLMDQIGYTVGSTAIGPSGWALFPLLNGAKGIGWAVALYAIGLLIGYAAGFFATYFFGFSKQMLEELNTVDGTPAVEAMTEEVTHVEAHADSLVSGAEDEDPRLAKV